MGRRRTGHIRERNGRFEAELAGEFLGTFPDRKSAQRMLAAAIADDAGKAPDAFSVFGGKWMDEREVAAIARKRKASARKERSVWRAHIESAPWFDWPLRRITPKVLQPWVRALSKTPAMNAIRVKDGEGYRTDLRPTDRTVGREVVVNSLKLVKLALDEAIIEGRLSAPNPARLVKLPRDEVKERDGELIVHASKEELARLFALALPPLQRAVFSVAIYAGLRLDEIWGLRWQDVHLTGSRPEIRVRRSYDGPVKTKNALRDVPLLPPAAEALKAWRAAHQTPPVGGLVFPRDDGGCHGETYTAGWRDKPERVGGELVVRRGWASRAGIRPEVTFLALRHTCGCHLAQGTWTRPLTLHEIKRWLGHSTIAVTERHYAALTRDNLHAAVEERGFTGSKTVDRE